MRICNFFKYVFICTMFVFCLTMSSSCDEENCIGQESTLPLKSRGLVQNFFLQFFDSSVEFLSSIVSTLLSFDEWNIYIIDFLTEYGVPLWNHTYVIEGDNDNLYFVPLYKGKNYNAINSFWVFYVSDGKMTYAPFKHDNSSEEDEALIFMCNLLSYRVFGEDNANNIIMKESQAGSRAWISVEQC